MLRSVLLLCIGMLCGGRQAAAQQDPDRPIGPGCAAWACEDAVIYAAALDSLPYLRQSPVDTVRARVGRTLHIDPATQLDGTRYPAVADLVWGGERMAQQRGHDVLLVDLAAIVDEDMTLRAGPPLVIFSPIDRMGPDHARLRAAVYQRDLRWGGLFIVTLVRGPAGWITERVAVEWQN